MYDKSDGFPARDGGLHSKLNLPPGPLIQPQMSKQTADLMDDVLNKHSYWSQEKE